jgi:cell division protein FtsB
MKWWKVFAGLLVIGGIVFGAMGGEYSTLNWWQLKQQVREQERVIAELRIEIDSLAAWAEALETDSATQERVAREKFGMIRDGEMLYQVEPGR